MSTMTNNDNRPMTGIECPEDNDVPMGRGGFVNSHKGHRRYLKMVQDKQLDYVTCKKADKMQIAWSIVHDLRALNPPARFLRKDPATGLWSDVGDKKFREKVSQALREHQPFIKAVIESNEADPEPLCTTKPRDMRLCLNLPSMNEQQQPQQHQPLRMTNEYPSILASEDKRRAFLASRTESNVNQTQSLPEEDDVGFNLSEFSVSQGPSFPDLNDSIASRRGSSGLDALFDILDDRRDVLDNLDAALNLNDSNVGPSMTYANNAGDNLDNERIAMQNAYSRLNNSCFLTSTVCHNDFHDDVCEPDQEPLKRSSDTSDDCYFDSCSPVKRCVLSRDKSEVSRKLKEAYLAMEAPALDFSSGVEEEGMESLLCALEKNFPFAEQY